MQQVDHYLRQAKAARELAVKARSAESRAHFINIAEAWEKLASERLELLQLKVEYMGGDALMIVSQESLSKPQCQS
jgi:hypothetical protein